MLGIKAPLWLLNRQGKGSRVTCAALAVESRKCSAARGLEKEPRGASSGVFDSEESPEKGKGLRRGSLGGSSDLM